jgi:DNA invertase Pin-like site-specific DNA recombinase
MALALVTEAPDLPGIYTRISSDDDSRIKQLGVKRQEKGCRGLVEALDWTLVDVYCDNNRTASKADVERPEFNRMLADLKSGRINRVVVLAQDRLCRRPDELETTMRLLRSRGITEIHTVTDGIVNIGTTTGRTMARVKGVFDIAYAEYISEKVSQKKDELAERGLPAGGGTRPFGYEADRMTVVPAEAKLIKEAARRVLAGESMYSVCADWTARGVRTVTGAEWLPNVLRGVLSAPRIAGLREHRGEIVGAAAWDPILDRETWESLRAVFATRTDRKAKGRPKALLTGVLHCGRCGAQMFHGTNNGKHAYACRKEPGRVGCGRLAVIAEPLESIIVEAVLHALDTPRLAAAVVDHDPAKPDIAALEARRDELAEMWAAGELSRSQLNAATKTINAQIDAARAVVADTVVKSAALPYLERPGLLRKSWSKLDLEQRRAILAAVVEVTIQPATKHGSHDFDPERIELRWQV